MLQVWTEFYSTADPDVSTNTVSVPGGNNEQAVRRTLATETLNFGSMQMDQGNAFVSDGSTNSGGAGSSSLLLVAVAKHWVRQDGRKFLVEEVPFDSIAQQLSTLPPASPAGNGVGGAGSPQSFFRSPAKTGQNQAKRHKAFLLAAKAEQPTRPGFVLDYNLINNNFTNFTFQSDTTYFLSGTVNLYGTTILEGGTVIGI